MLAIAGSLARKKLRPGRRGHAADAHAAVRRDAGRHGRARRRADVHPGARAGADRRAPANDRSNEHAMHECIPHPTSALDDATITHHASTPHPKRVRCSIRRSCGGRSSTRSRSSIRAHQVRNPVMFVVEVGSVLTTVLWSSRRSRGQGEAPPASSSRVSLWLWFTVLFANFAEAMAEGRGKAQADTLRAARRDVAGEEARRAASRRAQSTTVVAARRCARATSCSSKPATTIPGDGEVDRRRRLGRRERHHRRKRAGDPRERRRPQRA